MADTAIYWAFTIAFLAGMVAIGVYQFLGLRAVEDQGERAFDFWIGEGDVPGWWTAASLAAGWLLLGWMTWQMYLWYAYGLGAIWIFTVPWILCTVGLLFVPKLFRRFPGVSIPEILRFRFNRTTQILLGPVQSFAYLTWLAAEIYVLSAVLSKPLGIGIVTMAVIVSLAFGTYVTLGGFRSVLRTDLIQFVCAAIMLEPLVFERYDVSGHARLNAGRVVTAGFIGLSLLWAFEFPGLFDMYFLSSALISATMAVTVFSVFSKKPTTLSAYLAIILGTTGTFLFYAPGQYELLGWLPGSLTSSGLAYGVIALALSIVGVFLGVAFGTPPSDQVLARYDGAYYAGRREMYELNRQMKQEEAEDREAAKTAA